MHIVHIASEMAPVAKVGGLADVLLGMSHELLSKGHTVDVIIPKYDCIDFSGVDDLQPLRDDLMSYYDAAWHRNTIWTGKVRGINVTFIEPHHPKLFFQRGCFYGCDDDLDRFLYFSRATLEFLLKQGLQPDIIHLHDWQTAAIAPLYSDMYAALGLNRSRVVCTIHNIEYQGSCPPEYFDRIGLPGSYYLMADKLQDNGYPHLLNLLKGAIVFSHFVTTVSPRYAQEVLAAPGGRGLDPTLKKYQHKFVGILNGIDYDYWNPETDPYLPAAFTSHPLPRHKKDVATLDKKGVSKQKLRQQTGLAQDHRPIVGCISRLVPQKGIELIKHAIFHTLEKGGQFVLLGSSPIPSLQDEFRRLKKQMTDHPHIHLALAHNEELAHLIFAGSDILIVPSLFEPCGLTQMIALRYGTVPVVRKTGGLADTISDVQDSGKPFEDTNGFVFEHPDSKGLEYALDRAIDLWFKEPDTWRRLVINGMNQDFSWRRSADQYLEVYRHLIPK